MGPEWLNLGQQFCGQSRLLVEARQANAYIVFRLVSVPYFRVPVELAVTNQRRQHDAGCRWPRWVYLNLECK